MNPNELDAHLSWVWWLLSLCLISAAGMAVSVAFSLSWFRSYFLLLAMAAGLALLGLGLKIGFEAADGPKRHI